MNSATPLLKALVYFYVFLQINHVFPDTAFKTPVDNFTTKIPCHSLLHTLYSLIALKMPHTTFHVSAFIASGKCCFPTFLSALFLYIFCESR